MPLASFPDDLMRGIQCELSERFGGLTAYARAPAKGIWTQKQGQKQARIYKSLWIKNNSESALRKSYEVSTSP
jgi:hypothetical protein